MTTPVNLTHEPETIQFPETRYVFVERKGSIPTNAPQAWKTAQSLVPELLKHNQITGAMALYKIGPNTYRAGFMLAAPPINLPEGLTYLKLPAGKYSRFKFTGPYDRLPAATMRAFEIVAKKKIPLRDGFNIEHYVNDPATTPADQLITEILFPTK